MTTFILDPIASQVTPERDLPRTSLSLERFFRAVSYSPILGHQVYLPDPQVGGDVELQRDTSCSDPVLQYTWQPRGGGQPGRQEIAQAIDQAEQMIENALGFPLLPRWISDESVTLLRGGGSGWSILGLRLSHRHAISGGVEAWAIIQEEAPIVYQDLDGDGYKELATVSVATSVTDANEIVVHYPGTGHDHSWEIRPLRVTIAAGLATITFARHLAVKPELLEQLDAEGVSGGDDGNFLGFVDVWRRYNSGATMATVEWQPSICSDTLDQVEAAAGYLSVLDGDTGMAQVRAGDWDGSTWTITCPAWWQPPTRVRAFYRAGYRAPGVARPYHDLSPALERAIAFLALSVMDREWRTCEPIRSLQGHWRTDLSERSSSPGGSIGFSRSRGMLENPLGSTRAAEYAWRVCQPLMVGEVVLAH